MRIKIDAVFGFASSWTKTKKVQAMNGLLPCTRKPDIDNIAKVVLDALNGYAYKDDSAVVEIVCTKRYGMASHLMVEIEEII